jgi:WD40 repeat protein
MKFIRYFGRSISHSAPHLYLSAIPFSSSSSALFRTYNRQFKQSLVVELGQLSNWPALQSVFLGHCGGVCCVAFSPDGKRVVSSSWDMTIRIWDAETGHVVAGPFEGHENPVYSVAFSPDGKRVVSGSDDKTIRIWDAETGHMVAVRSRATKTRSMLSHSRPTASASS